MARPSQDPADPRRSRSDGAPGARRGASGTPDAEARSARPLRVRRFAAVILALETVGLLVVATIALVNTGKEGVPPTFAMGLAAFLLIFAAMLGFATASLVRHGRFGVGYGITWQLFQALVGAALLRAGLIPAAIIALGLAIAAFVLLFELARAATPPPRS